MLTLEIDCQAKDPCDTAFANIYHYEVSNMR